MQNALAEANVLVVKPMWCLLNVASVVLRSTKWCHLASPSCSRRASPKTTRSRTLTKALSSLQQQRSKPFHQTGIYSQKKLNPARSTPLSMFMFSELQAVNANILYQSTVMGLHFDVYEVALEVKKSPVSFVTKSQICDYMPGGL